MNCKTKGGLSDVLSESVFCFRMIHEVVRTGFSWMSNCIFGVAVDKYIFVKISRFKKCWGCFIL